MKASVRFSSLLLTSLVLVSTSAFAAREPSTKITPSMINNLPALQVNGLNVDNGPALAAVQPTASISVNYRSCAPQVLEASIEEVGNVLFVSIEYPESGGIDCMGPTSDREYHFQVSSDYKNQKVVVLNPVRNNSLVHF